MKSKRTILVYVFIAAMIGNLPLMAQESINASGSDANGSGGNVAYSIGQLVYTAHNGNNGSTEQGVQHAFEIFTIGNHPRKANTLISVYPNPVNEYLTLQVSDPEKKDWYYQMYDTQGKLIYYSAIHASQTQIDTKNLPAANYFIQVVNQSNQEIEKFKINKY